MKLPIYVFEPNDLDIFETVEAAERCIEPPEIKDGVLHFYDSEGQILEGIVIEDARGIEMCKIIESKEAAFAPDKLKEILIDSLEHLNYDRGWLETISLQELVGESLNFTTR